MRITFNKDLSALNTFRMKVRAAAFAEYSGLEGLRAILSMPGLPRPLLHIGGGSNLLFSGDFKGTVLHSAVKGILFIDNGTPEVLARVGAGESFDGFCALAASKGLWGTENLSLIPGEAGAAAVQNIGAYGVEIKDVLESVEAYDTVSGEMVTLGCEDCRYAYRDSVFKNEAKSRYIILYVTFKLSRDYSPRLSYGHVEAAVREVCGSGTLTPMMVRDAIVGIRKTKLPAVEETGSAGSFFRNPFVSREQYEAIASRYEKVPHFINPDGTVKIPAAWLIEQCGLKGHSEGNAAVWHSQPLVIVNATGEATPADILALEQKVIDSVWNRFSIRLSPEVEHI
jgi:UDP-N-acetylmuramate dehydrogenase